MTGVRDGLPPLTPRIARLPVDHRGYPVPWFVGWVDEDGREVPRGEGQADHRLVRGDAIAEAVNGRVCWICGQPLGRFLTFPIGPMCVVNRTTSEPPSHLACAEWAVAGCPFLSRPHATRREGGIPEGAQEPAGTFVRRNPGVTAMWTTLSYRPFRAPLGGVLFRVGELEHLEWWREGRVATRGEVLEAIGSGLPALRDEAEKHGELVAFERARDRALALVPEG